MRKRTVISILLTTIILFAAACSAEEPVAPPTPTPTPEQYLEKAAEAMAGVTTVQFNLNRDGEPLVLDSSLGALFISATGEYEAPDRVHANVKADIAENIIALDFLWLPEGVFMTNPLTGQYMAQPLEVPLDPSMLFDPQVGLSRILASRIEAAEYIGLEQIDGQDTIHLRGLTDAETVPLSSLSRLPGSSHLTSG